MNSHPLNEARLQRLVDGDLSPTERREFLLEADQHAEWWREIALGFVEDQVFAVSLSTTTEQSDTAPSRTRRVLMFRKFATHAAVLAVAGCLGYFLGLNPDTTPVEVTEGSAQTDSQTTPPYTVKLINESGGEEKALEVPAYDASQLTAFLNNLQTDASLDQANEDLKAHGYRIDWDTHFLSGQLQDGGKVLLPVSTLGLHYQGQ